MRGAEPSVAPATFQEIQEEYYARASDYDSAFNTWNISGARYLQLCDRVNTSVDRDLLRPIKIGLLAKSSQPPSLQTVVREFRAELAPTARARQ